ncbi:MAG TPA: hypothetical protein VIU11_23405 [Nakamurella sp.]
MQIAPPRGRKPRGSTAGNPLATTSKLAGHSDPGVTVRQYGHLLPDAADPAVLALPRPPEPPQECANGTGLILNPFSNPADHPGHLDSIPL